MATKSVTELIEEEVNDCIRTWSWCEDCKALNEELGISERELLERCIHCEHEKYQDIDEDDFIDTLVIHLADLLKNKLTTTSEEIEILKLLYRIYREYV